jgi:hypothetical protein
VLQGADVPDLKENPTHYVVGYAHLDTEWNWDYTTNLSLFAVPLCLLFFIGVFAGYILMLHREHRRFPWIQAKAWTIAALLLLGAVAWVAQKYYYHVRGT